MKLDEVNSDEYFYLSDGRAIKSLKQLSSMLSSMHNDVFSYHVNESKNDFANWIEHVIMDDTLANRIRHVSDKDKMHRIINEYIREESRPKPEPRPVHKEHHVVKPKAHVSKPKVLHKPVHEHKAKSKSKVHRKVKKEKPVRHITRHVSRAHHAAKPRKSVSHHTYHLKSRSHEYKDDFDFDEMISEINLGKQRDMLARISDRIRKMNVDLSRVKSKKSKLKVEAAKKKVLKPKVKKVRTTKTDKLKGKYKKIHKAAHKAKKPEPPEPKKHAKHHHSSFKVIDKSDDLKGINEQYGADSEEHKSRGGGFMKLFHKIGVSAMPTVKSMEEEKKAQETMTVLHDPNLNISGVADFLKGLLIGMVIGMIFLLIF